MEQMQAALQKVVSHPLTRIPFFLSIVAGAFVSIAVGFYLTYQVVVFIGARM
jgi:low affinity Fe/Cu permease